MTKNMVSEMELIWNEETEELVEAENTVEK